MISGKHILVLAASVTTGYTVQGAIEAIRYYGGEAVGIAAIFASVNECAGYPVASIFNTHDLPDYETHDSTAAPGANRAKNRCPRQQLRLFEPVKPSLREKVASGRMRADFVRPRALQFYTFCPLTQGGFLSFLQVDASCSTFYNRKADFYEEEFT